MPTVEIARMKELEQQVISLGQATEESLLRAAGAALGHALGRYFVRPGQAVGYLGKGHNGGDTAVALAILRDVYGWRIDGRLAFPAEEMSPLSRRVWEELSIAPAPSAKWTSPTAERTGTLLLLDGLVGTGAAGPLRGRLAELAGEMQRLRCEHGAVIAAVDAPSGVHGDDGTITPGAVHADLTLMVANPKSGLLLGKAASATGALALVPVPQIRETHPSVGMELICPQEMGFGKTPRPYDSHKGHYGRVWLWVGSDAYPGAAALAATGALRGGAGLVTVFTPAEAYAAVRALCPPEVMVRRLHWQQLPSADDCDALVIGCGLGGMDAGVTGTWLAWLERFQAPAVLDADALNALARHGGLQRLRNRHVLTPHPGEFARLMPDASSLPREQAAAEFCRKHPVTLVLKGSRTLVSSRETGLWINGTGGPSMASGGQGDVLAGVTGARLAQGQAPHQAAALAVWLSGRAAERALMHDDVSEESLTPKDCTNHLGGAFLDWRGSLR